MNKTRSKFVDLFRESVIIQAVIALALIVTICLMAVREQPVPDVLLQGVFLVLGFYFGSKTRPERVYYGQPTEPAVEEQEAEPGAFVFDPETPKGVVEPKENRL